MNLYLSVKLNALGTFPGSGALFSLLSSMELWDFPSVCKGRGGVFSTERLFPNPRSFLGGVVDELWLISISQLMGICQ